MNNWKPPSMTKKEQAKYDRIDRALTHAEECLENEPDDRKPWERPRPENEANLDKWVIGG